ncbi:hypothetical protein QSJ19_08510 [Gordonia sp. ABSL11-1]|uniref:hypothetical protein n=1 Tax=Gordonia sp. ABSL11-1 TaxID=3053924 RepID=UPI002573A563|nr:hypothetical protein [Gordonia sp. ABSL11-1]MDL9945629.1 hypothetical protein [Gordonia sp. ABSL11-1]
MARLTEQAQGKRAARIVLSMIAEPGDPATGHVLAHLGGVETLRLRVRRAGARPWTSGRGALA